VNIFKMICLTYRHNITKIFISSEEQVIYKNKKIKIKINLFILDVLKEKNKFKNSRDLYHLVRSNQ
jgi:hypothetical protein